MAEIKPGTIRQKDFRARNVGTNVPRNATNQNNEETDTSMPGFPRTNEEPLCK